MIDFEKFSKIPRLLRDMIVTEKIDGTNAQIYIPEEGEIQVGSRKRWITPGKSTDNFRFAAWVYENLDDLLQLGPGRHFGEWWGGSIQRGYGREEKAFSLFNVKRWRQPGQTLPYCCRVVPVLYEGPFSTEEIGWQLEALRHGGSKAAPGFMDPEGIIVYLSAAHSLFKVTLDNQDSHKFLL